MSSWLQWQSSSSWLPRQSLSSWLPRQFLFSITKHQSNIQTTIGGVHFWLSIRVDKRDITFQSCTRVLSTSHLFMWSNAHITHLPMSAYGAKHIVFVYVTEWSQQHNRQIKLHRYWKHCNQYTSTLYNVHVHKYMHVYVEETDHHQLHGIKILISIQSHADGLGVIGNWFID